MLQVPFTKQICSNDQSFNSWSFNIEKNMYREWKLLGRKAAENIWGGGSNIMISPRPSYY